MGNAVKLGDSDTGHGSHPPTPVAVGSSTVKVDGMPVSYTHLTLPTICSV